MKHIRVGLETSITRLVSTGIGVYAAHLAQALEASVDQIEVVPCAIPAAFDGTRHPVVRKLYAAYWQIVHARLILPLRARKLHCDLVHYTVTMPIPDRMPCPVISTVHDVVPFINHAWMPPMRGQRLRQNIRAAIQRSQHVITGSEAARQDLLRHFAMSPEQITAVPHGGGRELPELTQMQAQAMIQTAFNLEAGYVLCVGSLEPRKNLENVVLAFAELARRGPVVPTLVLAGGANWRHLQLDELIATHDLSNHVIKTGHVPSDQLSALFRCAGVFVYPSLYEGFGLPPLEAMRSNCPVITSNTSSLPEVVGDAGIMVDPRDPAQIATAIDQVLGDRALAERLRAAGLQRAREFSWERSAHETAAVYARVVNTV